MLDMTTQDRALIPNADADAPAAGERHVRPSALGASAGARLLAIALLLAGLWAGGYWALH